MAPRMTDLFTGEMVMVDRTTAVAVTVVCPVMVPTVADTCALPTLTAVTWPEVPGALETDTLTLVELHVADAERFAVLPSE